MRNQSNLFSAKRIALSVLSRLYRAPFRFNLKGLQVARAVPREDIPYQIDHRSAEHRWPLTPKKKDSSLLANSRGDSGPAAHDTIGIGVLSLFGVATAISGIAYVVLAIIAPLLPGDVHYLGMNNTELCAVDHCRLVDFLSHGKMSYGGALVAVGVMTCWLTLGPLRRKEAWAWWALLFGNVATYGSFVTFVAYGYFNTWHAILVCIISVIGAAGLSLTYSSVDTKRFSSAFNNAAVDTWLWHPGGTGRFMIILLGAGIGASGMVILLIASSIVFVPQDIDFLGLSSSHLETVGHNLVPIMAHDRAGFGGAMIAVGVLFSATGLSGFRSGSLGAWRAIAISGIAFYLPTLAIHLVIGYTSFIHLLPVYGGLLVIAIALLVIGIPLHRDLSVQNRQG
jgi:hypothetical protein